MELTATPVTSPRYKFGGSFTAFGTDSNGITGTVSWAKTGALIAAMTRRYPKAGMGVALEIGAKVAKGEMAWG